MEDLNSEELFKIIGSNVKYYRKLYNRYDLKIHERCRTDGSAVKKTDWFSRKHWFDDKPL